MEFSYIGLIMVTVVLLPNLLFVIFPPKNIPNGLQDVHLFFTIIERIGIIAFIVILLTSNVSFINLNINLFLLLMILCIVVYYSLWLRYVLKGQDFSLLFTPLLFIPIPMAIFPVSYFLFASFWINSIYLAITTLIFAIGHFVNSWNSYIHTK
ncbi:hypothetical protein U472_09705 [Orenia metallireducens]|uniref:Uncharacterized protein n=2 Tax=Orenia metallireducens TaxID=1413210 RepID=A0A1C0A7Q5_9FIRM|nr:hypothetical protein U472_09705 [Orenia metallireducens]